MTGQSIQQRITAVTREHRMDGHYFTTRDDGVIDAFLVCKCGQWVKDLDAHVAGVLVEALGLTQEYAVCFEDDEAVWLIGDTRYTRAEFAALDVPNHIQAVKPFVGTAWVTRWERANG